jgi:hypothetical protein
MKLGFQHIPDLVVYGGSIIAIAMGHTKAGLIVGGTWLAATLLTDLIEHAIRKLVRHFYKEKE